ncbi:MAG: hypothetical protein H7838_08305 [Magnetococcus sp. DMHC-8]
MNDGRIAASQDIVEVVTRDNFNLVWATVDWAIRAERFRLPAECVTEFYRIPHEPKEDEASLQALDDWMERALRPETRRRIFVDIRRAQFEAAKGAVQITIAEETQKLLRERKKNLFGPNRGSMEVTIRHLLDAERRALPWQAFRLLEAFRQRHNLVNLSDAVRVLIDHAELAYRANEMDISVQQTGHHPPPPATASPAPPQPVNPPPNTQQVVPPAATTDTNPARHPLHLVHPVEPVWNALIRCWMP